MANRPPPHRVAEALELAAAVAQGALGPLEAPAVDELDRTRMAEGLEDALRGAGAADDVEVVVGEVDARAGTVGVTVRLPWAGYGGRGATDASFGVGAGPRVR